MTIVNRDSTRRKYFKISNYLMDLLKKTHKLDIVETALKLGYSPAYFKTVILPVIKRISLCIDYDTNTIYFTCEKEGEDQ